jgi:Protein of unknown function DUF115
MSAENTYKGLSSFFSNCTQTIASLGKVLMKSKPGTRLPVADGASCIVLGNGPSLKTSLEKHPDFFKQHTLFCVNSFSITPEYTLLKPAYYVILDPGFWYGESEVVVNTIASLKSKTTWTVHLLVPHEAKKSANFREIEKHNSNIKISYFNYTVYKGFQNIGFWLFDRNMAMPQSQNVLVATLFLSMNTGFKEVYLFGADHGWHESLHVNDDNVLCFKDTHFYDGKEQPSYRPFYKGIHLKETFTMHEILVTFGKIFLGYMMMNDYAKHRKTKIFNASETSFIDAFERVKIK